MGHPRSTLAYEEVLWSAKSREPDVFHDNSFGTKTPSEFDRASVLIPELLLLNDQTKALTTTAQLRCASSAGTLAPYQQRAEQRYSSPDCPNGAISTFFFLFVRKHKQVEGYGLILRHLKKRKGCTQGRAGAVCQ